MKTLLLGLLAAVILLSLPLATSAQNAAEQNSPAIPQTPIELAAPAAPAQTIGELDLTQYRPEGLGALALQASKQGGNERAVQLQHWAVANGDGETGLYNLACFYSLAKDTDASIYWLQRAALKEGVDIDWVRRDSDLKLVRDDDRWPQIEKFLTDCDEYWLTADIFETSLILPSDYDGKAPLPLMIGLHGMGSRAKSFVDEDLQEFADSQKLAFLAVSGSLPKGPTSFHWSEQANRDLKQIDRALKELSDKLKVDPNRVGLFGFSQGGMMAIEIAARHPKRFAGAMALSPGGRTDVNLANIKVTEAHQRQGYLIIYGGKEAIGNVAVAKRYVKQTERLGARVIDKPYPDQSTHSYPLDFYARLPSWVEHIFGD